MYLGVLRFHARKPALLLGVGEKCASKVSKSGIRAAVCRTGSYYGITPTTRLPNGRLLWPADAFQRIVESRKPK